MKEFNHKWLSTKIVELGGVKLAAKQTGITRTYLQQMKKGKRTPTPALTAKLATGLGLPLAEVEAALGVSYPNQRLRQLLVDKGLNYQQMAKATGIRSNNISAIVNGKRPFGLKNRVRFAKALECDELRIEEALDNANH